MRHIAFVLVLGFAMTLVLPSWAAENPCAGVNPIQIAANEKAKLKDILENYNDSSYLLMQYGIPSLLYNNTGEEAYYLCFEFASAMAPDEPVKFQPKDQRDIYIVGLKLKGGRASPYLALFNPGGTTTIHIQDLSIEGARAGISIEGPGRTEVIHSNIAGDGRKSGPCAIVRSRGASLDDIMTTKCKEGIRVEENDISIANSTVAGNGIGIRVTDSRIGTRVKNTLIYGNKDDSKVKVPRLWGLMADSDAAMADIQFLTSKGGAMAKKSQSGAGAFEYDADEDAVLMLPRSPAAGGAIEFFFTDCAGETSNSQACGRTGAAMQIDAESFERDGLARYTLPDDLKGKTLVAIFTDQRYGSTVISQAFIAPSGNVTAIAPAPFDIPVQGSSLDPVPIVGTIEAEGDTRS